MDVSEQSARCSLDEVLAPDRLKRRPARSRNPAPEHDAFVELADHSASRSGRVLGRLAEAILECGNAESAGVSILEPVGDPAGNRHAIQVFRWHAVAGKFIDQAGGTLPRHQSPCGVAIDRNAPLLFDRPQRHFPGFEFAEPPVAELLTLPFYVDGVARGSLWAITHDPACRFDGEDLRVLRELAPFASIEQRTQADAQAREHANSVLQRAYTEQCMRSARLRQFATELTSAENRERRHFADELQENLQQVLVAARMQLASGDGDAGQMTRANDLIHEAVEISRKLVTDLRPPTLYELGLLPALRWLAEDLQRQGRLEEVRIECDESEIEHVSLSEDARALLFEGVRELLSNVSQHSGAKAATVDVHATEDIASVAVADDGHGGAAGGTKAEDGPGVGLFGIRERLTALGGEMQIESSEAQGTRVELRVPLGAAAKAHAER